MADAFDPNNHFQMLPSEKYADLPKETHDFLNELRPEEVETIRKFARLGKDGTAQLRDAIQLAQSVMTGGRLARWAIITVVGAFFGMLLLAEKIMQLIAWFAPSGGPPIIRMSIMSAVVVDAAVLGVWAGDRTRQQIACCRRHALLMPSLGAC